MLDVYRYINNGAVYLTVRHCWVWVWVEGLITGTPYHNEIHHVLYHRLIPGP